MVYSISFIQNAASQSNEGEGKQKGMCRSSRQEHRKVLRGKKHSLLHSGKMYKIIQTQSVRLGTTIVSLYITVFL